MLRLTYLHGRYPVLTETFIDREIQRLLDKGVDLRIVSIRRPSDDLSPGQRALSKRVQYLLPAPPPSVLLALLWGLVRHPVTFLSTLAWLVSRNHAGAPRYRTALHFLTGVYAAWLLRDRRGVHIHAHFVDRAATVALVASRLLRTTYSVTAHAREIYVEPVLLKERLGAAAFAVTCTEYNRRHLETTLGRRAVRKLLRLYHGIDLSIAHDHAGTASGPPLILSVAQLWERKGLRYLIDACAVLRDRAVQYHCEIVGDGPQRSELQQLIDDLQLNDHVRLTGPLPFMDVVERYRRATVFVLPCVVTDDGDRDGIPNVILEAMKAGVPVISTPVSGIPEVVRDAETGLVVPERDGRAIADAVERAFADKDFVKTLTSRAHHLMETEFDLDRNVSRLLAEFEAVAASA